MPAKLLQREELEHTDSGARLELGPVQLQGTIDLTTADEKAGTVEVLFLPVGAKALRHRFLDDPFELSFSLEPGAARTERLQSGRMAVLLDHDNSLRSQGGIVTEGTIDAGGGRCAMRLTNREDLAWFRKAVLEGEFRNVSMGVNIYRLRDVTEGDGLDQFLAVDYEPYEITFTPVAALTGAATLSNDAGRKGAPATKLNVCTIEGTMPPKTEPENQPNTDGGAPAPEAPKSDPTPTTEQLSLERDAGRQEERERQAGIRAACKPHGLSAEFVDGLIDDPKVSLAVARERILEQLANAGDAAPTDPTHGTIRVDVGTEQGTKIMLAMANALEVRAGTRDEKGAAAQYTDEGREFRGHTLMDMARECLEIGGRSTRGMSRMQAAGVMLRWPTQAEWSQGQRLETHLAMHSTSDFPLLLANQASKSLLQAYQEAPKTFEAWARRTTLPDFKSMSRVRLGEGPNLLNVPEGAEFQTGTVGERNETIQLLTYGRILSMTRQMMVNDDLAGFTRLPAMFGGAAARLESDLVYAQVTGNPNLSDGNPVFDTANHGNLVTGLGTLNVAALQSLRELGRQQKGIDNAAASTSFLNVDLVHLLVPEQLELEAQQLTSSIQAQTAGNVNPFSGSFRTVQAEPRLGAHASDEFYMMADPSQVDTLEYAFLQGEEGPVIETQESFLTDGFSAKVREDFGVAWVDWRGAYRGDL